MELADVQTNETDSGVSPADIPSNEPVENNVSDKPLSIREQLTKSIETVRTEEAKRVRDAATGKFTKSDAGAAAEPATEKPEIQKPDQNAQPEASKPAGPPSAWKAIWETMSPEAQALAVKRETEVEKGISEYRGKVAQLSEISQALEPLRPVLQQHGITTEVQAVKRLLDWEGSFRNPQTRMQAFTNLAQQYGIDLSTLAQNPSQAPSPVQDIPDHLRPVIDQFGNVVQDVNLVKQEIQNLRTEKVSQELAQFAKDKPHFEAVRVIMGQLMSSGIVPPGDLEGAYQKATALHPEVSAAIRAEEDAKRKAEFDKAQAEKARNARHAAASPSPRAPSVTPNGAAPKGKASVRDAILSSVSQLREEQRA